MPNMSSLGYRRGDKKKVILNPFSAKLPWDHIPKWILYGDKWARNSGSSGASPFTPDHNLLFGNASTSISPEREAVLSKQESYPTVPTVGSNLLVSNCGVGTMMSPPSFDSNGSVHQILLL